MGSEIANQRLHDHIIGKQRKVIVEHLVQFLQDSERRRAEWRPGTLRHKGTTDFECEIGDGKTAAIVNCIYANYLEARYPGAAWLYMAPLAPTLLYDGDHLRGALMPVKL